jgi:diguanylate cyclase (GGDEF)-like protein
VPSWSTQQLTELVAAMAAVVDEETATRIGIERAVEALEAEVGALVRDGRVVSSIGFPAGRVAPEALVAVIEERTQTIEVPGAGAAQAVAVRLEDGQAEHIVVGRSGEGFSREEVSLVRGMARVLTLTLRTLRRLASERSLREESERQVAENERLLETLRQRQHLLEKSAEIQRAISRRAPLQAVLDQITEAAAELLGVEVAALRMVDEQAPDQLVAVASRGVRAEFAGVMEDGRVGVGVGGLAVSEERLVVLHDYPRADHAVPAFAADDLQAAMAAPVHERGTVVGSLTVATYERGRTFTDDEQATLLAFAEHASLALMDAKTVGTMMHQAIHDSLTDLPNRDLLVDRLEHALARGERTGFETAILFIDLDGFKNVNDSLGHASGDELLVAVADRLRDCIRTADTAARLGGDEFAILVEDVVERGDAARLAERIMAALREPFPLAGRDVFIGASIGIATAARPGEDLLRNADLAMYRAKAAGKNRYEFFEHGMRAVVLRRLELEADLRRAVDNEEFVLHYQPIVDLASGRINAVEALVRWRHPSGHLVPPVEFIPVAEETGAIIAIGTWVIREACRQAAAWETPRPLTVSVNVSARQLLERNVADDVAAALREAKLDHRSLAVELTETVLMQDRALAVDRLAALKELGVRVAIDDFGTGYSSLDYLHELPLDALKIPKPFVDDIGGGEELWTLAGTIVDIGSRFGLLVVAEGIERPAQVAGLRQLGCQLGQGFLFSRPLPADELEPLLRTHLRLQAAAA